jgi:hypothetical protein
MSYEASVFLNCPFDSDYQRHFRALVFSVQDCGYVPRCALELEDASQVRIDKILRLVGESRYGIHDISRTELDEESGLPRFNMPLELGIFLGAKHFGGARQRAKACVVFDRERFRYQRFCSDIAGLDVRAHHGDERALIRGVRDALRSWSGRALPSGSVIFARYAAFTERLPELARELRLDPDELAFGDLTTLAALWIAANGD